MCQNINTLNMAYIFVEFSIFTIGLKYFTFVFIKENKPKYYNGIVGE